jgi:fumarate hydratase class I
LPDYFKNHPVYYAGPAKTPKGYASGSFGPTTAGRMDSYVDLFQSLGGSLVMLAKGNRSPQVTQGLSNFLQGVADRHETSVYLLKQTLTP